MTNLNNIAEYNGEGKEESNLTWFIVFISGILILAFLIDRRNKKINNNSHKTTNPNAKDGDSSNYMMGDNKYTNGGG